MVGPSARSRSSTSSARVETIRERVLEHVLGDGEGSRGPAVCLPPLPARRRGSRGSRGRRTAAPGSPSRRPARQARTRARRAARGPPGSGRCRAGCVDVHEYRRGQLATATSSRKSVMIRAAVAPREASRVRVPLRALGGDRRGRGARRLRRRLRHGDRERLRHRARDAVRQHRPLRRDLSGADLSRAVLASTNLEGTNPSSANLSEADLTDAQLVETNLSDADLTSANLTGATITDTGPRRRDALRHHPNRRHDRRHGLSGVERHDGHRDNGDDRDRRGEGHVVRAFGARLRIGHDGPGHGHLGDGERDRGRGRGRHRVADERRTDRLDDRGCGM